MAAAGSSAEFIEFAHGSDSGRMIFNRNRWEKSNHNGATEGNGECKAKRIFCRTGCEQKQ